MQYAPDGIIKERDFSWNTQRDSAKINQKLQKRTHTHTQREREREREL